MLERLLTDSYCVYGGFERLEVMIIAEDQLAGGSGVRYVGFKLKLSLFPLNRTSWCIRGNGNVFSHVDIDLNEFID